MATDQTTPVGATTDAPKPSILLIHGLWMTPLSWEDWIPRYQSLGYQVIAPGWVGVDDRTPQEIRNDPSPMNGKSIGDMVDKYEAIIRTLPTPPIIIGHSFGGLFVQILLSRGLGAVGIAIAPAAPAGILALPFSTIKSTFNALSNPFDHNSTVPLSESDFHYAFGNHLKRPESKILWEKYSIPAAVHVLWQGALGGLHSKTAKGGAHVDFEKADRVPLLLIAGSDDHVVPQSVVEKEKFTYKGPAVVELRVFEGRTHGVVNQSGWEEIADFGLNWAEKNLSTKP
jgi:non-heme chloroperoxidase